MEVSVPKSIGMSRYMRPKIISSYCKNKTIFDLSKIFNKLKLNNEEIISCKKFMIDNIKGCKLTFNNNEITIGKKIDDKILDDTLEKWILSNKICQKCFFPELTIDKCSACGFTKI